MDDNATKKKSRAAGVLEIVRACNAYTRAYGSDNSFQYPRLGVEVSVV